MIDTTKLLAFIYANYSFRALHVTEAPRGFVAKTFIVTSTIGEKYFLKLIPLNSHYLENFVQSLVALEALSQTEFGNIVNRPVKTGNGSASIHFESYLFTAFTYVEGEWTVTFEKKKLLELLNKLHTLSLPPQVILKEDFSVNFIERLNNNLDRLSRNEGGLLEWLGVGSEYISEVRRHLSQFKKLRASCQKKDTSLFVPTHGDSWANTLELEDGSLRIIDWDDFLLAPIERDIWYIADNSEAFSYYLSLNKLFVLDNGLYDFYLLRRYLDDLSGCLFEIFKDLTDQEHVNDNIADIKSDCLEWLRPKVLARTRKAT